MSFCFLYNIVSENHSVQNSPWRGRGVYCQLKVYIIMVRSNLLYRVSYGKSAKVNKCSYINEYINFFCSVDQDHPLTFNQ